MNADYNLTSPDSIDKFAEKLLGKTLREAVGAHVVMNSSSRGDLGNLVEKLYFKVSPPNSHLPDFVEAGVELKVTGVRRLNNGTLTPKERLVLTMINYHEVVNEDFHDSYMLKKIRLMLILFYLYEKNVPVIDLRFLAKKMWRLSAEDLSLIILDWEKIVAKIKAGKAHELSEGDTLYLGACTKGADSTKRTTQPFSDDLAKPRAFAFKPSYVKVLLEDDSVKRSLYGNLVTGTQERPLEETVFERLKPFQGRLISELFEEYGADISMSSKHRFALLANRLLGIHNSKVSEFEKAGIRVKTVRLQVNGMPKESISFPHFDYASIIKQTWDESDFKDIVESKFFFIVLQDTDNGLRFVKGQFWNMPYEDRLEAEHVWNVAVERVRNGQADSLPGLSFSPVAHVRPHGRDASDTLPAPGGLNVVKKCFWLNAGYIAKQLNQTTNN